MNAHPVLTLSQVLPPRQDRHSELIHPSALRHPVSTPPRHALTSARSASTRRSNREDDAGDQSATGDAVAALHLLLEARMRRRLFTVIDATNVTAAAREPLVAAANRHGMLPIAVVVATPGSICIDRQDPRPANRTVPKDVVAQQHQAMVASHRTLKAEGFPEIVFSDSLCRLLPLLERLSGVRQADLGLDGSDGLGDLLLPRRVFGPEILPLWRWKDGSNIAGGDRVAEIRLGQQYLTLALRTDIDGEGDIGFDVAVPCPHDDECTGRAWAPAYSITSLFRALNGDLDDDIVCTVHGLNNGDAQDEREVTE
ncbi:ATP-binding protein [Streptomyces globisporus]|uniref:ATP-binding protein n=1 Tax=Streptomyces TaxID=1883 RepID=UPI000BF042A4|nr:ATP-binding protein [Streptomyces sp. st170]